MKPVTTLLNKITMYRLLVLVLGGLISVSLVFTLLGRFSWTPIEFIVSLGLLIGSAYLTDRGFCRYFGIPSTMESSLITALILFLIVQPADSVPSGLALVLAGAVSSASKFLVSYRGKHIFNPAAFAAALLTLTGLHEVTWWIGSSVLWPFALVLGLLVVQKIRRFPLFLTFIVVAIILQAALLLHAHLPFAIDMKHALLASPLIFLATIMLTEPATMPPRRSLQMIFAALVAVLYVTAWQVGPISIYPEVALLIGNLFAFAVSPKFRLRLELKEIQKISERVYNYVFTPEQAFCFLPGQYMEWTLAGVPYDSRGNRRTFTLASSPTEDEVQLGLKYYEPASMYKSAFYKLKPGDTVYASQLAGNFTLGKNAGQKLAFIAGGIGITPFRSMIKYLSDQKLRSDIILLYVVSDPKEFAYVADLMAARAYGVRTIPIVTDLSYHAPNVVTTKLNPETVAKLVPDYADRTFYISGSESIVDASRGYLQSLGVARKHIKTDHFSGY